MKRLFLPIFVFLLLAGGAGLLGAFEIEVIGGMNGFTFQPDKTSAYTEPYEETQFTPYPYLLANIAFRHNISESLNWSVSFERDNLLQNSINALFGAKTDFFNVRFGPFLGFVDDFTIPDVGIIGNLELNLPGIVSLSISGSSTLGSQYEFTSHTYRETAGVKLGFWIQNAIPSLSANIKFLSRQIDESVVVDDTLFKYYFTLELFTKNHSISGFINLGYQTYKRVYKKDTGDFSDELSSWLVGFDVSWQVFRLLCIKAGVEIPLFMSAVEPMTVTQEPLLSLRVYAGVVLSIK
ncbi:hypothetical protein R84B8_00707 [Treponema sp. R8-4-B8]